MERDCFFALAFLYFFISTHTLTWSVTMPFPKQHINNSISTHTLTWSVTISEEWKDLTETISTHTLTWSVTVRIQKDF